MGGLTDEMKQVLERQRLGFVATACPDGTSNQSPKGTTTVWDDDHIVCADLRSLRTTANLKLNPLVGINVVDWFTRKACRFRETATVIESGPLFDELVSFYNQRGLPDALRRIQTVVTVKVQTALLLVSPAYDRDVTEDRTHWESFYQQIRQKRKAGIVTRTRIGFRGRAMLL